ncbi:MAG: hypothetical protein K2F90_02145 [Clostridiales bacterium]|nr:hypothetical protein [Clostridiales bacterium]
MQLVETDKHSSNLNSPPSVCEVLLYAIIPFLLIAAGAMPATAIVILPITLPLLYLLYKRFGPYLPLGCIAVYGVLALSLNYDILTVIYCVTLFFAFCGLAVCMQFLPAQYLLAAAVAVVFAVVGAFVGVGIVRGAEGVPVGDIAARYVVAERADPVISYLARDYYDGEKPQPDEVKLKPTDVGYADAAIKSLSEWAKDDFDTYTWYYCIHCGALLGLVGFFIATGLNGKVSGRGNSRFTAKIGSMRLPRSFLWTMALPATVTGLLLGFFGGYEALSATVMHAFCTLPSAFGCYTLLGYFASLFRGKARVAAYIVFGIIGVVAVLFPFASFILSIFGVCDCILNLRYWTEYIRS